MFVEALLSQQQWAMIRNESEGRKEKNQIKLQRDILIKTLAIGYEWVKYG